MEMIIDFPEGSRVDAHFGSFTVQTDQPNHCGGQDSAPTPFATFLAALGTCAGYYVLSFCHQRNIPTDDIHLIQRTESDPITKRVSRISLEVQLPPGFPEKYVLAVVRAAEQCAVKKLFEHPPAIEVSASMCEGVRA